MEQLSLCFSPVFGQECPGDYRHQFVHPFCRDIALGNPQLYHEQGWN